jgi:uncharacterized membrane protein
MAERSGILPQGEELRRALKWLSERRREDAAASRGKLVDEAALRFDLSPAQVEFLLREWHE